MKTFKDIISSLSSVSRGTWERLIFLVIAVANMILQSLGINTFIIADENISMLVSVILLIVSTLVAYWKNNSFTDAAQKADEILREIKNDD